MQADAPASPASTSESPATSQGTDKSGSVQADAPASPASTSESVAAAPEQQSSSPAQEPSPHRQHRTFHPRRRLHKDFPPAQRRRARAQPLHPPSPSGARRQRPLRHRRAPVQRRRAKAWPRYRTSRLRARPPPMLALRLRRRRRHQPRRDPCKPSVTPPVWPRLSTHAPSRGNPRASSWRRACPGTI